MNEPMDGLVDFVEGRHAEEQADPSIGMECPAPIPHGVAMQHEAVCGFLNVPTAQTHELKNLEPVGRSILGSAKRWDGLAIASQDLQLALEQSGFGNGLIALSHEAHYGEGVIDHAFSRQHVSLSKDNSNGIQGAACVNRPDDRMAWPNQGKGFHRMSVTGWVGDSECKNLSSAPDDCRPQRGAPQVRSL
jgi:hypothetical protein